MYFKGQWKEKFPAEATAPEKFADENGKGKTVKEALSVLDARQWNDFTNAWSERKVDVWLPEFETKTHLDLSKLLVEMGMPTAFDGLKADFSALSDYALCLSLVMQDAVIKVDEEGMEAAAVSTGVFVTSVPQRSVFHADHPFLYLITESNPVENHYQPGF